MHISKVTQNNQATIPANIREYLDIREGDRIKFEINDHKVVIQKVKALDIEYLKSLEGSLSEWSSESDEEAYRDL